MSDLAPLPLDIKKIIASFTERAWFRLWYLDPQFAEYANSHEGRLDFVHEFTVEKYNEYVTYGLKTWTLFGKLHRINDLPAIMWNTGGSAWYTNGELHRDDDKPPRIYANGAEEWYINGHLYKYKNPNCSMVEYI